MKIIGKENIKDRPWIDFSSLSMLQRCPRSYYWRVKRALSSGSTAPLINGSAYHEARATYRQAIKDGVPYEIAKESALEAAIPIMREIKEVDPRRNVTVALSTLDNYFERWCDDSFQPLTVEVGFAFTIPNHDFCVVGKIDEYARSPFGNVVMEFKTTSIVGKRWNERASINLQIDIYITAIMMVTGELPFGGVLDVVPIHENPSKRQEPFRIGPSPRSEKDIENCLDDLVEWWNTLSRYENDNVWPRNTESCVPLMGFTCPYTVLCQLNPNPFKGDIEVPSEYREESWVPFEALNITMKEVPDESITTEK